MSGVLFRYNEPASCLVVEPPPFIHKTEIAMVLPNWGDAQNDASAWQDLEPTLSEPSESEPELSSLDRAALAWQGLEPEPEPELEQVKTAPKTSKKMVKHVPKLFNPLHSSDLDRFTVKALKSHCNDKKLDTNGTRMDIIERLVDHYKL